MYSHCYELSTSLLIGIYKSFLAVKPLSPIANMYQKRAPHLLRFKRVHTRCESFFFATTLT